MQEILDKTDVEMIVDDRIFEIIKNNLTIEVSKGHDYSLPFDQQKLEVEVWFGGEKIDSDWVEV